MSKRMNRKSVGFEHSSLVWDHNMLVSVWVRELRTIKEKKLFIIYYEILFGRRRRCLVVVVGWGFYCEMKTNK